MADKSWKARERQGASFFGTTRKPVSGRQHDKDGDDGEHPRLHIQSKHRQSHAVVAIWDAAKKQALKSGKTPVVILSVHKRPGQWLLIKDEDLAMVACEHQMSLGWVQIDPKTVTAGTTAISGTIVNPPYTLTNANCS